MPAFALKPYQTQALAALEKYLRAALNASCGHAGPKVVYGEACRLGDARLADGRIRFRQLPHVVPQ